MVLMNARRWRAIGVVTHLVKFVVLFALLVGCQFGVSRGLAGVNGRTIGHGVQLTQRSRADGPNHELPHVTFRRTRVLPHRALGRKGLQGGVKMKAR